MYDLGIENGYVYLDGSFHQLNLYIKNEKISALTQEKPECTKKINADGKYVLPGFIDPHVHFELGVGQNISRDDFYSGSVEAVLGGVTTYIDFLDPVKRAFEIEEAFEIRNQLAEKSMIDYSFHATLANPTDSAMDIIRKCKKFGINSIKLFTTYADTDRRTYDKEIYSLLKVSKEEGAIIVVHAESDDMLDKRKDILVMDHEKSRPVISENIEVMKLATLARKTGGNLYIVHVSAGSSVKLLKEGFSEELRKQKIILESCPHYFLLNSDCLMREDGYKYTMTPPIRVEEERILLNRYRDFISTIGTDHCPYTMEQKKHAFTSQIPMGIGGIRYSFLNMYQEYEFSILDKFTGAPAKAYGLKQKGSLIPGKDADVTIFDPGAKTYVVDKMSVYDNKVLEGSIETVLSRGAVAASHGEVFPHKGNYIRRGEIR